MPSESFVVAQMAELRTARFAELGSVPMTTPAKVTSELDKVLSSFRGKAQIKFDVGVLTVSGNVVFRAASKSAPAGIVITLLATKGGVEVGKKVAVADPAKTKVAIHEISSWATALEARCTTQSTASS